MWKVIERIGLTIFSEATLTCWKRFLRIFQMIQAVNFTFQCFSELAEIHAQASRNEYN